MSAKFPRGGGEQDLFLARRLKRKTDEWYSVDKIVKQRKVEHIKQYLIEWSDCRFKPSWQDEEIVPEEYKRQFYIQHTRTGKRRKRPCILNKSENATPE